MPKARRSRIHVRRDIIWRDRKTGEVNYALAVETLGQKKRYGLQVDIQGPSVIVYRPNKPLSCGARAWIETHAPVVVHRRPQGANATKTVKPVREL